MAADVHDRISRRKELGGGSGVGEVGGSGGRGVGEVGGGGGRSKLGVCGGRIDGHGSRIGGERGRTAVRGRRIGRGGFRINTQGDLFVPDSEDEDAMEDMASEGAPSMELPPEVQARLETVLAGIDPVYHDVFISLYKVMVPAFFKCN